MGIDPQVAFTVWPWWSGGAALPLSHDTMVAGWDMPTFLLNADWSAYGQTFTIAGVLRPTGTLLDKTMLMTLEAARQLAQARAVTGGQSTEHAKHAHSTPSPARYRAGHPGAGVSSVLIRITDDVEPSEVVTRLAHQQLDLDITVAPAYVNALRRQLRQTRRLIDMLGTTALVLAGLMGLGAMLPPRRQTAPGTRVVATVTL